MKNEYEEENLEKKNFYFLYSLLVLLYQKISFQAEMVK